ncbi:hypothetical protein Q2941_43745 [Bradyrhizobium sp. UFLA05-153]
MSARRVFEDGFRFALPILRAAYGSRGGAHQSRGEFEPAIDDYSAQIELTPIDPKAHGARSKAHADKQDEVATLADQQKAIELTRQPDDGGLRAPR